MFMFINAELPPKKRERSELFDFVTCVVFPDENWTFLK